MIRFLVKRWLIALFEFIIPKNEIDFHWNMWVLTFDSFSFDEEILHISGSLIPARTGSIRWLDKKSKNVCLADRFEIVLGILEFQRGFKKLAKYKSFTPVNVRPVMIYNTAVALRRGGRLKGNQKCRTMKLLGLQYLRWAMTIKLRSQRSVGLLKIIEVCCVILIFEGFSWVIFHLFSIITAKSLRSAEVLKYSFLY